MLRRYGETAKEEGARRADELEAPAVLSRVHWVRPELVIEITYLTLTADGLVRQAVYQGLRQDKRARDVRQER